MKVAIYGYGNLGKGVELAAVSSSDVELVGVFTRRDPLTVNTICNTPVYKAQDILNFKSKIDVLILCGGSATDLPKTTSALAKDFNVIDSFDTHVNIPEHFNKVNKVAKESGHTALISCGWDPGMFSIMRLYSQVILPKGSDYTFWGPGISQGHSDAIRRIDGVLDARQYTIPRDQAVDLVRRGDEPTLTARDKHERVCYVVVKEDADKARIESEIKNMPAYFADYDTIVNFVSQDELNKNHNRLPHGGHVIRTGQTGKNNENKHTIEYTLKLDSNPEFTGSVLLAFARAINKMHSRGDNGCKTVFNIAPADLSPKSEEELRSTLL